MNMKRLQSLINETITNTVNTAVASKLRGAVFNDEATFIGYNPIEKIRGTLFQWIAVPFSGTDIFCQLRCPNATQLEQCGDISNITIGHKTSEMDYEDILKVRNYQEELCKLVMNNPTFDEVAKLVGREDFVISQKKKELADLKEKFESGKSQMTETEKSTLSTQIRTIELQLGFILPDDTMAFITRWAMGNDISDIKKLTRENFLRAAALAKAHGKAPSDYISGVYTDFNRVEIDSYAAIVLDEFLKEQKAFQEVSGDKRFVGRGKHGGSILPKKP